MSFTRRGDQAVKRCGPVTVPMMAFQFVEGLLRAYPAAKVALAAAQDGTTSPEAVVRTKGPQGRKLHWAYQGTLTQQTSPEFDRLRRLCEVVESVLPQLDVVELEVVEAYYFEQRGKCDELAAAMRMHHSGFYRYKDRAVLGFMVAFQKVMDLDLLQVV